MGVESDDEFSAAIDRDASLVQMKDPAGWFGYWLKELRDRREWSIADVAIALIDLGSTEASAGLLEEIEDSRTSPTIDLVVRAALVFGVAPLSLVIGYYAKDQVYLPLADGPEYLTSESSRDVAKWWSGVQPDHWSGMRRADTPREPEVSSAGYWVLDRSVPIADYHAAQDRIRLLEKALTDLGIEVPDSAPEA